MRLSGLNRALRKAPSKRLNSTAKRKPREEFLLIEWLQQHLQTDTSTSDFLFWITISLIGLWIGMKLSFKKKLIIRLPLTLGDSVEPMQGLKSKIKGEMTIDNLYQDQTRNRSA